MLEFGFILAAVAVLIAILPRPRADEKPSKKPSPVDTIAGVLNEECPFLGQRQIDRLAEEIAASLENHGD